MHPLVKEMKNKQSLDFIKPGLCFMILSRLQKEGALQKFDAPSTMITIEYYYISTNSLKFVIVSFLTVPASYT